MKIQLLHFDGCPNVDAARKALRKALTAEQLELPVEEIDIAAQAAPEWSRGWGAPTILIDGKDLVGQEPLFSCACRRYDGGAPSVETIRAKIAVARTDSGRHFAISTKLPVQG